MSLFTRLVVEQGSGLALGLVFFSAFFIVLGLGTWLFSGGGTVQRRLEQIVGHGQKTGEVKEEGAFKVQWLKPAVQIFVPKAEWRRSHMQSLLVMAGYRRPNALITFVSIKVALATLLPLLILVVFFVTRTAAVSMEQLVLALVPSALIGFYLPNLVLRLRIRERKLSFIEGFPDALDMLVVCVEAGLGLDAAIQRVGNDVAIAHPDLASEFRLVSLELRAGKQRAEALRALGDRVDVDDVRALSSLLIQAENFGTSVASTLREYASDLRLKRIQRARAKAAKLPVKLIFPIMFFIFPALFLVILGPGLIRISEEMSKILMR